MALRASIAVELYRQSVVDEVALVDVILKQPGSGTPAVPKAPIAAFDQAATGP